MQHSIKGAVHVFQRSRALQICVTPDTQACRVQPEACEARARGQQLSHLYSQANAHHECLVNLPALLDDDIQLDDEQLPQLHELFALVL